MQSFVKAAVIIAAGVSLAMPAFADTPSLKMYYFASGERGVGGEVTDAFIERVNQKGKGLVQIQTQMVDPSSIPARQIGNAIKGGVVDLAIAPPGYFSTLVPGAEGLTANSVNPAQQRKNGAYELLNSQFEERVNAHYLAQVGYGQQFNIFTTTPIKSLDEFKGLRLGSTRTSKAFFEALGAQPVAVARADMFTALERGMVKGYANLVTEIKIAGWGDVTKYKVAPGYNDALLVLLINKQVWSSLNNEQRAVLNEAAMWLETEGNNRMVAATKHASEDLEKSGIKTVTLPGDEGKKLIKLANESIWNSIVEQAPDFGPKLKKVLLPE